MLLGAFRSVVVPLKAVLMNVLSLGASYGLLVWIFQDGHFSGLLGFERRAPGFHERDEVIHFLIAQAQRDH